MTRLLTQTKHKTNTVFMLRQAQHDTVTSTNKSHNTIPQYTSTNHFHKPLPQTTFTKQSTNNIKQKLKRNRASAARNKMSIVE
ncbi:MAG: hypothetical protein KBS98_02895, partial [Flavobacterium sp.]|nr:hypothetical protein [Candidatus Neoflavobacterium equi]